MSRYATPVSPAWSNTSLEFVGLPAAVGDEAFVSYYTADKKLFMGGFRAADGEQLMYPCHGDRTAATRASIGAVEDGGLRVGDMVVVPVGNGVQGYSIPADDD